MKVHHVQAIVEILPERSFLDRGFEVAIGRGEHPDVHRLRLGVANFHHHSLLKRAQELDLERERHLPDLV